MKVLLLELYIVSKRLATLVFHNILALVFMQRETNLHVNLHIANRKLYEKALSSRVSHLIAALNYRLSNTRSNCNAPNTLIRLTNVRLKTTLPLKISSFIVLADVQS
jgi:hypothetical protein